MRLTVPIEVKMDTDEIIARLKEDDFVQVVRCKWCKHWDEEFGECDHPNIGRRIQVPAGFYCGWGERKENE